MNCKNYNVYLFLAKCACGTKLVCTLSRFTENDDIAAKFIINLGTGKNCGPSYLRAVERLEVIKFINECGSIEKFRAKR